MHFTFSIGNTDPTATNNNVLCHKLLTNDRAYIQFNYPSLQKPINTPTCSYTLFLSTQHMAVCQVRALYIRK